MGNAAVQNGVQTPQLRGTGIEIIVTARANRCSDDIDQQMDRLDEDCDKVRTCMTLKLIAITRSLVTSFYQKLANHRDCRP